MSSNSKKPDFDSMSPLEMMDWMESLEKRKEDTVTAPRFKFSKLPLWLMSVLRGGKTSHASSGIDEK